MRKCILGSCSCLLDFEGSTHLSLHFERGNRRLKAWSTLLQQKLDRWENALNQLPEEEWYKELERQMDYWLSEIDHAGIEMRRYFRKEVLPRLEGALRELKRRLREMNKEEEARILEIKLKELERI